MTDQPWLVLRETADLLHAAATAATLGPWVWQDGWGCVELVHQQEFGGTPAHPANVLKTDTDDWAPNKPDKAWIAAMNPAIAEHLEAAFRDAATHWFDRISEADGHLVQLALTIREALK
jgi:hypothetical protein